MNQQLSSDTLPTSYVGVVLPTQCRQVTCLAQPHRCSNGTISAATTLVGNSFQSTCFVHLRSHRPTTQETIQKKTPSIPLRQTSQGCWASLQRATFELRFAWFVHSSLFGWKSFEMSAPFKRSLQCMRQPDGEAAYTTLRVSSNRMADKMLSRHLATNLHGETPTTPSAPRVAKP